MSLRYVILEHQLPASPPGRTQVASIDAPADDLRAGLHFDLMFELDSQLVTFALPRVSQESNTLQVERLPDHRIVYLTYEGEISNNRGHVKQWDAGTYVGGWTEEGRWEACLDGRELNGSMTIARVSNEENVWDLRFDAAESSRQFK